MASASHKYDLLRARLQNLGSVLVAYSGGVDSTLLAVAAHAVLGDDCLAVMAISDTHTNREVIAARDTARQLGLRLLEVDTHELSDSRFRANTPDRCYYCKSELFGLLRTIAETRGLRHVADGTNADDVSDHRPGSLAAREYSVVSPLMDAGMNKADIREVSRMLGLPTADKPSMACLSSRFPYGTEITEERLRRVARAEEAVRELGLVQFRVRDHGDIARLEVAPEETAVAWERHGRLAQALRGAGFTYATLDLDGYRTGSLNEVLSAEAREKVPPLA